MNAAQATVMNAASTASGERLATGADGEDREG